MTAPSNSITDATVALNHDYLHVVSDGTTAQTHITLSDGTNLGLIQKATWSLGIGDAGARCVVETIASPAEVAALVENTTIRVILHENPLRVLWAYYMAHARKWFKRS